MNDRYTVDGLDLWAEFHRFIQLDAFVFEGIRPMADRPPTFKVRRVHTRPRTRLAFAVPEQNRISLTIWDGMERYDAQEALLHELAHIFVECYQFAGPFGQPGRVGHGDAFWSAFDTAFSEAFPGVRAAPRTNRYHGRYAEALKRSAQVQAGDRLVASIDEVLVAADEAAQNRAQPKPVIRLPEPLKSLHEELEPPRETWDPEVQVRRSRQNGRTSRRDDGAVALLQQRGGCTIRDFMEYFGLTHGEAKTLVYRLVRDGRAVRAGRGHYRSV